MNEYGLSLLLLLSLFDILLLLILVCICLREYSRLLYSICYVFWLGYCRWSWTGIIIYSMIRPKWRRKRRKKRSICLYKSSREWGEKYNEGRIFL